MEENPKTGEVIGYLSSTKSNAIFSYTSINYPNAISVDSVTGKLAVKDSTVFYYELNQEIEGKIIAKFQNDSDTGRITIKITDVFDPVTLNKSLIHGWWTGGRFKYYFGSNGKYVQDMGSNFIGTADWAWDGENKINFTNRYNFYTSSIIVYEVTSETLCVDGSYKLTRL